MTWALIALLGLGAGVISGLFGVGGAVVIIPGLVLIGKLQQHTAHGTSLAALLLPVGLLGVLEYSKRQQVNWGFAAVVAVGLLIGAYFGARLASIRCSVRRCMLSRRAVSETLRLHSSYTR